MTELNCDAAPDRDRGKQSNPPAAAPSRFHAAVLIAVVATGLAIVLTKSAPAILALVAALSKGTPL